ncbi:hypothetical protein Barb4_03252 [Bacteroidales bacterium Barb4]|nr:hypothetical protein Barb4_03252 [Bacteroidales bacterium Barb4]
MKGYKNAVDKGVLQGHPISAPHAAENVGLKDADDEEVLQERYKLHD